MKRLALIPLTIHEANAFVDLHHRHRDPVAGHKFSLGNVHAAEIVGVVIVGRPIAKGNQDGRTLEILRCATDGSARMVRDRRGREHSLGVCSFLEGAACRAAFALGYRRVVTYTLKREPGVSLVAAGFRVVAEVKGRDWHTRSRPRVRKAPLEDKWRWEWEAAE